MAGTETKDTPERRSDSIFRNRNFMLLWCAYGISACGDHLSEMALLKSQDALHSPNLTQMAAKITFVFMLPFLLFGPLAGVLADRLPRRGLMVMADLARAAIMFSFAWLLVVFQPLGEWGAYIPLLFTGIFATVFSPARSAMLPTLIRPTQLMEANAMTSGLGIIATMTATVMGGYLARHYAPQVAFRLDAMTFIVSAVLLLMIRPPKLHSYAVARSHSSVTTDIRSGLSYILSHWRVMELILFAVLIWSAGAVVRSVVPTVVRDVYGRHDYQDISAFQAILGGGMLIGALILTAFGNAMRSEVAISWSLLGIGTAVGLLALSAFAGFAPSLAMVLGAIGIFFAGVFATAVMAGYGALMQRIIPDYIRGRVFGVTDLVTIAGLLVVTGALSIPKWTHVDQWVGVLLLAVMAVLLASGLITLMVRQRRSLFRFTLTFWRGVNGFYARWWFRLQRIGPCTLPTSGPVLLISNHTSSIDPILLIAACPRRSLSFMIAQEYYDLPVFGGLIKMIECIPARRDGEDTAATRASLRHLRAGKVLGIFPEGRIAKPGELIPAKPGAAMLALHSRATVVPAWISGTMYRGSVLSAFFRRQHGRVRFGKPIDLSAYYDHYRDRAVVDEVAELMMRSIRELKPREGE